LPTRQAADKAARASSCKRHQILTTRDAPTDDNWPAFSRAAQRRPKHAA
jgi:hypothetical protein